MEEGSIKRIRKREHYGASIILQILWKNADTYCERTRWSTWPWPLRPKSLHPFAHTHTKSSNPAYKSKPAQKTRTMEL